MPLTVKQMLDYSAITLLQTGDLSTTARRLTDFMEASGDFPAPFSNDLRVALDQIFVEEVSRGRIEGAFALAKSSGIVNPATLFMLSSLRLRTPTSRAIPTTGLEYMCSHVDLGVSPYDENDFIVGLACHYTNNLQADNEFAATNPFTVEGVSIGYGATPATAVWTVLSCISNGSPSVVMDPATNSVGEAFRAQLLSIPKLTRRYIRVALNVAAGGYVPCGLELNTTTGIAEGQRGGATTQTAYLTNGQAVGTGGRLGGTLYSASFIASKGNDGRPVVLGLGDSIEYGKNETGANFAIGAGGGAFARAMVDTSTSLMFLGANMCVPGTGPADIAVNGRSKTSRKWDLLKKVTDLNGGKAPFTDVFCNHGTNSLGTPYNTTIAFVQMIKDYVAVVRAEWPGIKVTYETMKPKATTTDGYQTVANQTAVSIDTDGNVRWNFNDKLLADKLDGAVDYAVNTAQYVSAPSSRAKWDILAGGATLAQAATSSAQRFYLNETDFGGIQVGDEITIDPDGTGSNGATASVTALDTTTTPNYSIVVATGTGNAGAIGAKVKPHLAADTAGLHPGTTANKRMVPAITAWKNTRYPSP